MKSGVPILQACTPLQWITKSAFDNSGSMDEPGSPQLIEMADIHPPAVEAHTRDNVEPERVRIDIRCGLGETFCYEHSPGRVRTINVRDCH